MKNLVENFSSCLIFKFVKNQSQYFTDQCLKVKLVVNNKKQQLRTF